MIGGLFSGISVIYKLGIAVFIAMWLTTYGTEERSPISFFASYLRYHFLTPARVGYFQGREIPAERKTNFSNKAYVVEADEEPKETWITLATMKGADNIE